MSEAGQRETLTDRIDLGLIRFGFVETQASAVFRKQIVFIAEGGHILQRRVPVQGLDALLVRDVVHLHVRLKAH